MTSNSKEYKNKIKKNISNSNAKIFVNPKILNSKKHIEWFQKVKFNAIICVYWPWLLKKEIFSSAKITVNFHPAYLPFNRGWYPHVFSFNNNTPFGVTLHQIEKKADTGAIWVRKKLYLKPLETLNEIYIRSQEEIVKLFKKNWKKISSGQIKPKKQIKVHNNYNSKKSVKQFDLIELQKNYLAKDLINQLRSRSFGNLSFSYFKKNNEKIYIKISLSKNKKFD